MAREGAATTTGRRRSSSANGSGQGSGEPTPDRKRTVLRRERVIVLPDGVDDAQLAKLSSGDDAKQLAALLGLKSGKVATADIAREAWVVVGEFEGTSDTRAIEAHAGKNGSPDAIPGTYKAPSTRNWKGGEVYERPPAPKVERKRLED